MIKTTELSDFVNTEMIIPKELISFFGSSGERLAIIYQNREYLLSGSRRRQCQTEMEQGADS